MNDIGSFTFGRDGRVTQRIRHGGRPGGRVWTWHIVGLDESDMTAILRSGGTEIVAPVKRSQLEAARRGLGSLGRVGR